MKLVAPLDSINEVNPLIDEGAQEFYAGLYLNDTAFGARPVRKCNFTRLKDLKQAVNIARQRDVDISFCLNTAFTKKKKDRLFRYIEKIKSVGINKIIIYDLGIILDLKEHFPESTYILSTIGACFNSYSVNFYRDLGISRIILPRQLSLEEIKSMIRKNPEVSFELPAYNITCEYINGLCQMHWLKFSDYRYKLLCLLRIKKFYLSKVASTSECKNVYKAKYIDKNKKEDLGDFSFGNKLFKCTACAVDLLKDYGLDFYKIIGRGFPTEKKIKDIRFIRRVLRIDFKDKNYFKKVRKVYGQVYKSYCQAEQQCQYPYLLESSCNDF